MAHNIDWLVKNPVHTQLKDGRWVFARPVPDPFVWRVRDAWLVLTGKCDALKWTEQ